MKTKIILIVINIVLAALIGGLSKYVFNLIDDNKRKDNNILAM